MSQSHYCRLYLTGLSDGSRTDRFDSLLTWTNNKVLDGMTAQLKYDTQLQTCYMEHDSSLCKGYALSVQLLLPKQLP